jgi:hypothetical protein
MAALGGIMKKRLFAGPTIPNATSGKSKICMNHPQARFPCSWIDIYNISLSKVSVKARSEFAAYIWKCFCRGVGEFESAGRPKSREHSSKVISDICSSTGKKTVSRWQLLASIPASHL